MATHALPLFPLGLVLFPSAPLALHIFEPRYREMIASCLDQNQPFGVVLIKSGVAEQPDATFHMVGTTAQISDGVKLDDGRYLINTLGQQRFRIDDVQRSQPYDVATVSYLEEGRASLAEGDDRTLRTLYDRYWDAIAAATGVRAEAARLPEDVVDLTYWMAHRLQVENAQKQHWLECDVATRLREMETALRAELSLLPARPGSPFEGGWRGSGSWN